MLIEATVKPLTYRWPGGEVRLEPGKPVDLPQERAERILAKASGKVRAIQPMLLLCNGCSQGVVALHNLGGGLWRCVECTERRPVKQF